MMMKEALHVYKCMCSHSHTQGFVKGKASMSYILIICFNYYYFFFITLNHSNSPNVHFNNSPCITVFFYLFLVVKTLQT